MTSGCQKKSALDDSAKLTHLQLVSYTQVEWACPTLYSQCHFIYFQ